MARKTAMVVAPGRGTYNKAELGYLTRRHADKKDLIMQFDDLRVAQGQTSLSELDRAARYTISTHTRGDNASALIYASAYADFLSIAPEPYDLSAAIRVAAQELMPDVFIVLGSGNTLGGSVAQSLIRSGWRGWQNKTDFKASEERQKRLISLGA